MKRLKDNKKFLYALVSIVVFFVFGFLLSIIYKNSVNVRGVLSTKYDTITCIDKNCNGISSTIKDNKNTKVKLINSEGKVVGNYSYKNSLKLVKKPIYLAKNYMIMKKEIKKGKIEYSINTKNAKEKYKTNNDISHISNYIALETIEADIDYTYNVIKYDGKVLYKGLTDFEIYKDGLISYGIKDGKSLILNSKGRKILDGYKVEKETDDYLIIKNTNNNLYYYFDIDTLNIKNEGFSSYIIKKDNSIEVLRKVNNEKQVFLIRPNGLETSKIDGKFVLTYRNEISKELGDDYRLYQQSVNSDKTTRVFVDSINDNSFGIYDIKEKKYDKIYDYLTSASYSEVVILPSKDEKTYLQVICNKPSCKENKMFVYAEDDKKIIYNQNNDDNLIEEFNYYSNGYKVVKFTKKSSDNYKNKYVVFDKKDKELLKDDNPIVVLKNKLLFGMDYEKVLLFNPKSKNFINDENNLAVIKEDKYYLYSSTIVDKNGKKLYEAPKGYSLLYYNNYAYSTNQKNIKLYDFESDKIYTYKMTSDEGTKMKNKESMIPFKSVIFVNNDKNNYSKIINVKSNKVKKLKNEEIFSITINEDYSKLYLITTKTVDKKVKYGLYILD